MDSVQNGSEELGKASPRAGDTCWLVIESNNGDGENWTDLRRCQR